MNFDVESILIATQNQQQRQEAERYLLDIKKNHFDKYITSLFQYIQQNPSNFIILQLAIILLNQCISNRCPVEFLDQLSLVSYSFLFHPNPKVAHSGSILFGETCAILMNISNHEPILPKLLEKLEAQRDCNIIHFFLIAISAISEKYDLDNESTRRLYTFLITLLPNPQLTKSILTTFINLGYEIVETFQTDEERSQFILFLLGFGRSEAVTDETRSLIINVFIELFQNKSLFLYPSMNAILLFLGNILTISTNQSCLQNSCYLLYLISQEQRRTSTPKPFFSFQSYKSFIQPLIRVMFMIPSNEIDPIELSAPHIESYYAFFSLSVLFSDHSSSQIIPIFQQFVNGNSVQKEISMLLLNTILSLHTREVPPFSQYCEILKEKLCDQSPRVRYQAVETTTSLVERMANEFDVLSVNDLHAESLLIPVLSALLQDNDHPQIISNVLLLLSEMANLLNPIEFSMAFLHFFEYPDPKVSTYAFEAVKTLVGSIKTVSQGLPLVEPILTTLQLSLQPQHPIFNQNQDIIIDIIAILIKKCSFTIEPYIGHISTLLFQTNESGALKTISSLYKIFPKQMYEPVLQPLTEAILTHSSKLIQTNPSHIVHEDVLSTIELQPSQNSEQPIQLINEEELNLEAINCLIAIYNIAHPKEPKITQEIAGRLFEMVLNIVQFESIASSAEILRIIFSLSFNSLQEIISLYPMILENEQLSKTLFQIISSLVTFSCSSQTKEMLEFIDDELEFFMEILKYLSPSNPLNPNFYQEIFNLFQIISSFPSVNFRFLVHSIEIMEKMLRNNGQLFMTFETEKKLAYTIMNLYRSYLEDVVEQGTDNRDEEKEDDNDGEYEEEEDYDDDIVDSHFHISSEMWTFLVQIIQPDKL